MSSVTLHQLFQFTQALVERGAEARDREAAEAARPGKPGDEGQAPEAGPSLSGFVAAKAAERLNEALDTDLFEILAEAWLKFREVLECADPARHPPGQDAIVTLHEVEITSTNTPLLHLTAGGVPLPDLRFTLELTARFKSLQLVVRDARIRALRPGLMSAHARLKCGGFKLGEQLTPEWQVPGEISCGEGIPIPRSRPA